MTSLLGDTSLPFQLPYPHVQRSWLQVELLGDSCAVLGVGVGHCSECCVLLCLLRLPSLGTPPGPS